MEAGTYESSRAMLRHCEVGLGKLGPSCQAPESAQRPKLTKYAPNQELGLASENSTEHHGQDFRLLARTRGNPWIGLGLRRRGPGKWKLPCSTHHLPISQRHLISPCQVDSALRAKFTHFGAVNVSNIYRKYKLQRGPVDWYCAPEAVCPTSSFRLKFCKVRCGGLGGYPLHILAHCYQVEPNPKKKPPPSSKIYDYGAPKEDVYSLGMILVALCTMKVCLLSLPSPPCVPKIHIQAGGLGGQQQQLSSAERLIWLHWSGPSGGEVGVGGEYSKLQQTTGAQV